MTDSKTLLAAYRAMLLSRRLEEKIAAIYRAGGISGGVYLGRGQEAVSAALGISLKRDTDVFAPLIRDQAGRVAFGEDPLDCTRTYLGKATGPMRGRDGNIHRGRPREGMPAMISHLGAMLSVVSGMLLARRMQGRETGVGGTCLGDGATSTGSFHEGLNLAAVEKLPLVVLVANNQYAYSTPNTRQFACEDLTAKAAGYGVAAHHCAGNDLAQCLEVVGGAVAAARAGGGPQLVVADLLRLCGHGEHDDAFYVDPTLRESPLGRDCIDVALAQVLDSTAADRETLAAMDAEIAEIIAQSTATAQKDPAPNPYTEEWCALKTYARAN